MQRLPGRKRTASAGSPYIRSTPLPNEQSQNRPAIETASRHAGNNDFGIETSSNNDDQSASTTRSGKKRKRENSSPTAAESATPRPFACPYLRHDPHTYGRRSGCRGPSFKTIHRLKEHLYRTHEQGLQCHRCLRTFKTEDDIANHLRSADLCEVNKEASIEGFSKAQRKELSKRRVPGAKSAEDKWRHIYRILFPNCDKKPDPFYESFVEEAPDKPSPVLATQRVTWLLVTPDVPSQLETILCVSAEEALDMKFSSMKRRRFVDGVRRFGVMIPLQLLEEAAAVETDEMFNFQSLEEEGIGNSGRTLSSSESAPVIRPSNTPRPRATPALCTFPEMQTSNVLSEGSHNRLPTVAEARLTAANEERLEMGDAIGLGDWSKFLRNEACLEWSNGGDDLPGLSYEEHSDSSHAQSFASFGTQIDGGVNTVSYAAGDADPLMETHEAWAPAPWLKM